MDYASLLPVLVAVLVLLGIAMLAMAVGVMFSRPCLRGSCGGTPVVGPRGERLSCGSCSGACSRDGGVQERLRQGG